MEVKKNNSFFSLPAILDKTLNGAALNRDEIDFLLRLSNPEDAARLFRAARRLRRRHFGDQVFLYGFLYFSTYCRNNCIFCQFRRDNRTLERYRKTPAEILAAARGMAAAGVHLIDLTMGEDPVYFNHGETGFDELVNVVRSVAEDTGLPVMVSPGVVPEGILSRLADAGAHWYACYQETYNRSLFSDLRCGQKFEKRMARKQAAGQYGLLVEEGLLCGVGESVDDIADAIVEMQSVQADQVRAMTFVPHPATPLGHLEGIDHQRELLTLAVMRLVFADSLIPASLDVEGLSGLNLRLQAGANVVTSLVPPGSGLAGVANATLDIQEARRTPGGIVATLSECGLRAAKQSDYREWVANRRLKMQRYPKRRIAC